MQDLRLRVYTSLAMAWCAGHDDKRVGWRELSHEAMVISGMKTLVAVLRLRRLRKITLQTAQRR